MAPFQCVGSRASFALSGRLWFLPMVPALDNCKQLPYSITTVGSQRLLTAHFAMIDPHCYLGGSASAGMALVVMTQCTVIILMLRYPLVWACISALAVGNRSGQYAAKMVLMHFVDCTDRVFAERLQMTHCNAAEASCPGTLLPWSAHAPSHVC